MRTMAAAIGLCLATPAAALTEVRWTGPNVVGSSAEIAFGPFTASSLRLVSGSGRFGQLPGPQQKVDLSIRVGAEWRVVDSSAIGASGSLRDVLGQATFTSAEISGLRLGISDDFRAVSNSDGGCVFFGGCLSGLTGTSFIFGAPGQVVWSGDNRFSGEQTILFDPFLSDGLLGVEGDGYFGQLPGPPQFARVSVRVDGEWQDITQSAGGASGNLSGLLPGAGFGIGKVDGLRLSALNLVGPTTYGSARCDSFDGCLRNLSGTTFNFRVAMATAAVPEPSTWSILLLGFGMLGHQLRRRPATRRAMRSAA